MLRKTLFLISILTVSLSAPWASAAMFKVFGGINDSTPKIDAPAVAGGFTQTYSGKIAPAFGGGLEFMLGSPSWGLEIDGIYAQRKADITLNAAGDTVTQTEKMLEVPILLRWHAPSILSIGFGPYFAKYLGQITQSQTIAGTTTTAVGTYSDVQQKTSDYGLAASVGFDFPIGSEAGFIVDARYTMGLANNSTADSVTMKFNDIMVVAGFRFGGVK